jgi:hypothetical protein
MLLLVGCLWILGLVGVSRFESFGAKSTGPPFVDGKPASRQGYGLGLEGIGKVEMGESKTYISRLV